MKSGTTLAVVQIEAHPIICPKPPNYQQAVLKNIYFPEPFFEIHPACKIRNSREENKIMGEAFVSKIIVTQNPNVLFDHCRARTNEVSGKKGSVINAYAQIEAHSSGPKIVPYIAPVRF